MEAMMYFRTPEDYVVRVRIRDAVYVYWEKYTQGKEEILRSQRGFAS